MRQSPYQFIPATTSGQGEIPQEGKTPSMVSDDDVATKGLLPHNLLSRLDIHG
jgi:hypothetical protein